MQVEQINIFLKQMTRSASPRSLFFLPIYHKIIFSHKYVTLYISHSEPIEIFQDPKVVQEPQFVNHSIKGTAKLLTVHNIILFSGFKQPNAAQSTK
jgi:hypothetical protein